MLVFWGDNLMKKTNSFILLIPIAFVWLQYAEAINSWVQLTVGLALLVLFLVGFWHSVTDAASEWSGLPSSCVLAAGAAVVTYWLNNIVGLGPLVASGLMVLAAAYTLNLDRSKVAYAGAFVGMSAAAVGWLGVLTAGVLMGLFYTTASNQCPGIGGKLGAFAAAAGIVALVIFS